MINESYIQQRLEELGISPGVLDRYGEHHRFYHTLQHVTFLLNKLEEKKLLEDKVYFLTAVFHDAVYDPRSTSNEEDSRDYFLHEAKNALITGEEKKEISQLILDTKAHQASSERSQLFIELDLGIFDEPLDKLIEYEQQIFKEFQFVDYKTYKEKRIEILRKFNTNGRLDLLIEYVKFRQPSIALFAGSFNPFHKGHYNVLEKAERIFEKVIIAFGKNPEKNARNWPVPKTIGNRQITEYEGLLTDFIDSLGYDVVVVRGLRNSTDFQYEQNQYRYIQELKPDIKIVNVFCDKEFEHISSSGIRTLEKYNKHESYLLK
ncbi:MAG: adenylyltransferase/cytidyltransferase family protein [Bacteroidia bacterium]